MSKPAKRERLVEHTRQPQTLAAALDASGRPCLTRVRVWCPICGAPSDCHRWSLHGSGKRCGCGALLSMWGAWTAADVPRGTVDKEPRP